jgi:hypothetical protein
MVGGKVRGRGAALFGWAREGVWKVGGGIDRVILSCLAFALHIYNLTLTHENDACLLFSAITGLDSAPTLIFVYCSQKTFKLS